MMRARRHRLRLRAATPERGRGRRVTSDATGWWWRVDGTYLESLPEASSINGSRFALDERGYMVTGWASQGGQWFYLRHLWLRRRGQRTWAAPGIT